MTHRERILKVMLGEMVDKVPFVPRLDLWWLSNATRGTLPKKYEGMMPDDISRANGWPAYHMVPNFADIQSPNDILHRSIGLFNFKNAAYKWEFTSNIEVKSEELDGQQIVEYHTPIGVLKTIGGLTEEMKKAGASLGWVQEHLIKTPEDYKIAGCLFENINVIPQYKECQEYIDSVGDEGVVAMGGPTLGGSPMHMIQKEMLDDTMFFYEYNDHYKEMAELAEKIGVYFDKVLDVLVDSPAEVILWGANYDDMLTYPPYFEKEILPWLQKASTALKAKGKVFSTHTDGENLGLMDLIAECGADVAESVTPYPMTKVKISEYYSRWKKSMTIMGGIPESILLADSSSIEEFEAYMDMVFTLAPGDRLILGTADSTPPDADFDRLLRIQERIEKEGSLPFSGGEIGKIFKSAEIETVPSEIKESADNKVFEDIQGAVMAGKNKELGRLVNEALGKDVKAVDILHNGMIPAMDHIGEQFKAGDVFIPEVLLSARAMNDALEIIGPHLSLSDGQSNVKILIGTVQGDMHDIGKNLVAIMLRGSGFTVNDLGVNVANEEFLQQITEYKPDIVCLSALLTTTMSEMKNIIGALVEMGLRDKVKVLIGGAPVNQRFADNIGADGYANDAGDAVDLVRSIMA